MPLDVGNQAIAGPGMISARAHGRLTGGFYLLTIAAGIYAEAVVRAGVTSTESVSTFIYRTGAVADLVMLASYIAVTVLVHEALAAEARTTATMAAGFSMVGIAILGCNLLLHIAPTIAGSSGTPPAIDLSYMLRLHGAGYTISLFFFAIYCILTGLSSMRLRALPLAVGALMLLGGLARLLLCIAALAEPSQSGTIPDAVRLLPLVGEVSFAVWLALFGWSRHATQD